VAREGESVKKRRGISWDPLDLRKMPGRIKALYVAMKDAFEAGNEEQYAEACDRFLAAVTAEIITAKNVGPDQKVSVVFRPARVCYAITAKGKGTQ
jgi:hypothetical protein